MDVKYHQVEHAKWLHLHSTKLQQMQDKESEKARARASALQRASNEESEHRIRRAREKSEEGERERTEAAKVYEEAWHRDRKSWKEKEQDRKRVRGEGDAILRAQEEWLCSQRQQQQIMVHDEVSVQRERSGLLHLFAQVC